MIGFIVGFNAAIAATSAQIEQDRKLVESARLTMGPEAFKAWKAERDEMRKKAWEASEDERRHRELVEAQKKPDNGPMAFLVGFLFGGMF